MLQQWTYFPCMFEFCPFLSHGCTKHGQKTIFKYIAFYSIEIILLCFTILCFSPESEIRKHLSTKQLVKIPDLGRIWIFKFARDFLDKCEGQTTAEKKLSVYWSQWRTPPGLYISAQDVFKISSLWKLARSGTQ